MKPTFCFENKKLLHCSGIYCITNTENHKRYVGSSKGVYYRVHRHISDLRRSAHPNPHFQSAFDKYGAESFRVILLEECREEDLATREQHWIDVYQTYDKNKGYNQANVSAGRSNVWSDASRAKVSRSLMGNRKIWMCDKVTGDRIKQFDSLYEAASYIIEIGNSTSSPFCVRIKISDSARNKLVSVGHGKKQRRPSAYGYKWEV